MSRVNTIIEEAKKVNPDMGPWYDKAQAAIESMEEDGHSGMSWSFTRSTVNNFIRDIPAECINEDGSINHEDTLKWVKDWIDNQMKKEKESAKEDDIMDGYVASIYDSALRAFTIIVNGVTYKSDLEFVAWVFRRLARELPIIPIEDIPENWYELDLDRNEKNIVKKYWCTKCGGLRKVVFPDGSVKFTDLDRSYCAEKYTDENGEERESTYGSWMDKYVDMYFPIKMPYMPADARYKVNVEEFVYEPKHELRYTLIKTIQTPTGDVVTVNEAFKEYEIVKPGETYRESIRARVTPEEYFEEKAKHNAK